MVVTFIAGSIPRLAPLLGALRRRLRRIAADWPNCGHERRPVTSTVGIRAAGCDAYGDPVDRGA
jgi:hypothetical protein